MTGGNISACPGESEAESREPKAGGWVLLAATYLEKNVQIIIDRPAGSHHPEHKDMIYPVNYGFIPGTLSGDGEELDVYLLGVNVPVTEYRARVIAVIHRYNDAEDKLVAAPEGMSFTKEEIAQAVYFQERYFDSEVVAMEVDI